MAERESGTFLRWLARPESMVGLSAIVVSIVAVAVSAYEARIMREWQRAAVWPYVQLSRSLYYDPKVFDETGEKLWTLTFNAANVGVGPAQVKDFRVTVDGEPYLTWKAALQALLETEDDIQYGQSSINGTILPAEATVRMIQYRDLKIAEEIYARMSRLDFEACFCSVFGECWRTRYSDLGGSEKTARCARGADSFQE